ncbi:prion-like-(Q/N-rich) domain-bearing protein 25 [Biomphalaria pfeifferi]|uniref:Prion-like-(Q/N-rich) domain-bearing protein 25 n=1 Tax=Biomphalaria pfeifferi TaxID=112525 RepID=A0AAD8BE48_BIOPF|nr:prion-like-(Q/N-rich) domain-bearing protein 25 [Biomphalaria pfeifferi]
MWTGTQIFVFIFLCFCTIKHSDAYTRCTVPDTTKAAYGQSCNYNSDCLTDYCNSSKKCSCSLYKFVDLVSGFCVEGTGNVYTSYTYCGYLASPSSISTGNLATWTISGASGTYITMVVLDIDMNPTICSTNYLEILEGSTYLLNKTCDASNSTLRFHASKSNSLKVSYRKPASAYRGFRAIYYTRSRSSELSEAIGYIVSPGYPVSYNEQVNYTWLISTSPGRIINTTFLVDTELCCDYVRVYDGRDVYSTSLANISGSLSLRSVRSSANYMLIQFTSNSNISRTGFIATYEVFVLYGYTCSSFYKCLPGLVCTGNVCDCLSSQFYDTSTNTCRMRLGYGNTCTSADVCTSELTCSLGHCSCASTLLYNPSNGLCQSRVTFGSSCPFSEECLEGLVCRDSVCRCLTSQYYDSSARICKSGLGFGKNCTNSYCVNDLYCNSGVCSCSSSQYYDQSLRICKPRITYGDHCNSTGHCAPGLSCLQSRCGCLTSHYYDLSNSICRPRLAYGNTCTSTGQCQQHLECTENSCRCSANSYYNNTICLAKLAHAVLCSSSGECLTPYVCTSERIFTKTCLCPSDTYYNASHCLPHGTVQAAVSSDSQVKTDSILLKWTTQTWTSNLLFTVEWGKMYVLTNASELYIDGLSPGRVYNFTIATNIPGDDYYNNKSVQSKLSIVTKQAPGNTCSSFYKCSDESSCVNGVCVCLGHYYLNTLSKSCEPRLAKGYECTQTDECKETLTCLQQRCGCQSGYYYNNTRQDCYSALKRGQPCDPSIEKICELPDLICARESIYTSIYTCQRNTNGPDLEKNTSEDNSNTVIIAVAVVGWVAAPAAVIIVFVICSRNRKKSLTKGKTESQSVQGPTSTRSLPKLPEDLQSTTKFNPPGISQVESTLPALTSSNIKPKTFAKTSTSAETDKLSLTSGHHNKMYTHDSPDRVEHTYDVINTAQFLADANDDAYEKVIQNVRTSQENEYDNSNI